MSQGYNKNGISYTRSHLRFFSIGKAYKYKKKVVTPPVA